jgi:chromosome segregation ATPase
VSTATKSATDTLAEIDQAIDLTKLKLVNLSRDLEVARTEAVASGVVGTTSSPRVRQLARKVAEAEARIADLEEEQAIASRLAAEESERATQAGVEQLETQAEQQRSAEADAWNATKEKFAEFVAATSPWAKLTQQGLDTRRRVQHEFAHRPELEGLLAVLRPFIYPQARDLGDVVHLLAGEVDTSGVRVNADNGLERVNRSGDPPWGTTEQGWTTQVS